MRDSNLAERLAGLQTPPPNRLADGPTALFVYGTLQFEPVLVGLIGRVPERQPATTLGWRARLSTVAYTPVLSPHPALKPPACC